MSLLRTKTRALAFENLCRRCKQDGGRCRRRSGERSRHHAPNLPAVLAPHTQSIQEPSCVHQCLCFKYWYITRTMQQMCVCVCVCARAHACVRACVSILAPTCVCECVCVCGRYIQYKIYKELGSVELVLCALSALCPMLGSTARALSSDPLQLSLSLSRARARSLSLSLYTSLTKDSALS